MTATATDYKVKMMVSDEVKRWLVVGIAMNKIAAPVLRDFIKQGMDTHYMNLDIYCSGLATPCTLKTLTYHQVSTEPCFKHLKFQNVNNNLQLYGMKKKDLHKYNCNINSSVDLAKLFLPDYLAEFSGFDESLDMSAILRLLGFNNPAPIFYSPNPLISIQLSADNVREDVRNTWGHCNVTDWTEVFFSDCFSKLKTLVRSLGLPLGMEKMTLDRLSDWETKGCQLCMGHAVDHNLLSLVQQDVKKLIMTTEESLAQQRVDLTAMQNTVTFIQDQQSATRVQMEEHDEQLAAVLEWKEEQMKENEEILAKLVSVEKMLSEELLIRVEKVERGLAETDDKVEQLEKGFAKTDDKVEQLEQGFAKTDATVEQLEQGFAKTDDKVEQLQQGFAKNDDKVKQLEQGFAKTDDKVEQLEQGFAKNDDKVKQLEQGFAKTDDKVEQLEKGFAKTDDKVEQLEQGFAKTDDRVKQLEQGFAKSDDKVETLKQEVAKTDDKVEQLEQGLAKTDDKVEQLEQGCAKTDAKVEQLEQGFAKIEGDASETGNKVKQLEEEVRSQRMNETKSEDSAVETFDVKSCRSKLAEHYKRTASVPTSVWTKKSPVDIRQIYTRLSWVKKEQTPAESSQSELKHYTDVFTANKNGVIPKRILVQGQTGIGKSTFVKKLSVDFAEFDDKITGDTKKDASRRFGDGGDEVVSEVKEAAFQDYEDPSRSSGKHEDMSENQKESLKKFELVLVINLKEVSKCPNLREIVRCCSIFPEEETALVDDLLSYITKNQEKVLLVFDGYDEYRCGSNSEIYEIFRGNKLRNCCVLITTRISKADELREFKDVHAEITGFSEVDRVDYMIKVLGCKAEAEELEHHLSRKKLTDLTRVPLLLLFFCTLWKKGKLKSFPETKTKLYVGIVQYILDYNQGKDSPARFGKVHDFKDILAEIGKVALDCLLKDDHVFEYDELSAAVLCDESFIIGLLQITEYAENLRPSGMVSFIHKSIQEFLAAWYIANSCVPDGNLGGIEQYALTLEDFQAWENVFQFVCGLSDDGAVKVFQLLTSLGISDPKLDLSKTIPDVERETDVCPYVVSNKHGRFSDLVYDSFREVQSKADLLDKCLDCTSGVILVTRDTLLSELLPDVNVLNKLGRNLVFILGDILFDSHGEDSIMYKSLKYLDCLQLPVRISESSDRLEVEDLMRKLRRSIFDSIICLRNGRFQFYITQLFLHCDDYAKLFEESTSIDVPSGTASLCSQQSCLKFLTVLGYRNLRGQTVKALGGVIRSCKHLYRIEVEDSEDYVCYLLEQVQNPSECSVAIATSLIHPDGAVDDTSAEAVQLASLLPRFYSITTLHLNVRDCCAAALDTLVTSITHKTVKELMLSGIHLTPEAAKALGRSLPEMSSLHELWLFGMDGSILQAEEMNALFGGFNETLLLYKLSLIGFSEISCLAPFNERLRAPNLKELHLANLNLNEHDLCGLLKSWSQIRNLTELHISGNQPGRVYFCTSRFSTSLTLDGVNLTSAVATALGQILPEMSSLQTLRLIDVDGNVVQNKEMEALFGKLHAPLPLHELDISSYNMRGSLAPLIKSLRFFPNVIKLELYKLNMDEDDQCGLLESLKFIPDLTSLRLRVQSKPLVQEDCGTPILTYERSAFRTSKSLNLYGITLTPAATIVWLGRSLPEMSSLETLELQAEETEALFGGISKIMPLSDLNVFSGFSVMGSIAPLTNSFRFFPNLARLCLVGLNMDEHNLCVLLESLQFIPKLMELKVCDEGVRSEHCRTAIVKPVSGFTHEALRKLQLIDIDLTPAVAVVLGRLLPEMLSLHNLRLQGPRFPQSVLKFEGMEALFGGFNKRLPLVELYLSRLSAKSCSFGPVAKSFRFFPDLEELYLREFIMDEHNLCALLESLKFLPNLKELNVEGQPRGHPVRVDTLPSITHNILERPKLDGVSVIPVSATLLDRSLAEMSSQETPELTGVDGSSIQAEEMEALFGGFMPNLKELDVKGQPLGDPHCCTVEVNKMASTTHKTLKQLKLNGVCLTPVTAALVGRLLPEMSSLETLELTGVDGSILQAVEMEALFCGFNKTLPLHWVTLRNFSLRGCLATLCKGFHAFPNLKTLKLERLILSELDQCSLLESLRFIRSVRELSVKRKHHDQGYAHPYCSFTLEAHERLYLVGINLTPAAATALGRSLPEMPSLQVLHLTGVCILQDEEIEALFGGFYKRLPLCELTLSGFIVRGCLSSLIRSLHFFSNLKELKLENLAIDEHDQCALLKSFRFIRNLTTLSVRVSGKKCLDSFHYFASGLKTVVSHAHDRVDLHGINLTSAIAVVLGQLLREMSFLRELTLTGMDGSILGAEEMEALFGGLDKVMPLYTLTFSGFSVRGSITSLHRRFRFFPSLKVLELSMLNMDEHDLRGLLECFRFIPNLQLLNLSGNPLGHAVTSIVPHVINLKKLRYLWIDKTGLFEEDLIYVRDTVQQALPGIQVEGAKTLPWWRSFYVI